MCDRAESNDHLVRRVRELHAQLESCRTREAEWTKTQEELDTVLHELSVQQEELRTKNEDLEEARVALEVARRRYFDLYDYAPIGYFTLDRCGLIRDVNLTAAERLGREKSVLLGKPLMLFVARSSREPLRSHLREVFQGYACSLEVQVVSADGESFEALFESIPTYGQDGEISESRTAVLDITQRRRMEDALRLSEERFRSMFEHAPVAYHALDDSGRFIDLNHELENMLGYQEDELIGRSFGDLWAPEIRESFQESFAGFLEEGYARRELQLTRKNGAPLTVLAEGRVQRDIDGQLLRTHCVLHNITERKQAEEEKERLEAQLRQAQKLEAIGTLAGGIAHDFNNILNVILGYSELALASTVRDAPAATALRKIVSATRRAEELVKQILSFGRQGNGPERQPFEMGPAVKEILRLLRSTLPSTIELRQTIGEQSLMILGDPTQIHQVVVNLCTNAAHAMRNRGGILEVSLAKISVGTSTCCTVGSLSPGSYVTLRVRDTGHGMDSATLGRIFDPYFTTKEVGEGTGLGLAVVHGIILHHKGAVRVWSEPGRGTIFDLYFPKSQLSSEKTEIQGPEVAPKGIERILFVDDEEMLAGVGELMLGELGYQVTATVSPVEAIELFRMDPYAFDLVITDFTMPQLTGMALARQMLRIRVDMPIILCTGYNEMISEEKAIDAGLRALVMKPFSMMQIAETIRKVLDPVPQTAPLERATPTNES